MCVWHFHLVASHVLIILWPSEYRLLLTRRSHLIMVIIIYILASPNTLWNYDMSRCDTSSHLYQRNPLQNSVHRFRIYYWSVAQRVCVRVLASCSQLNITRQELGCWMLFVGDCIPNHKIWHQQGKVFYSTSLWTVVWNSCPKRVTMNMHLRQPFECWSCQNHFAIRDRYSRWIFQTTYIW